jgi:hypothetical protein
MSQGGKRQGAGRKPAPEGTSKVPYATKLSPHVVEYLRQRENAAQSIESAIERSNDYREWRKSSG